MSFKSIAFAAGLALGVGSIASAATISVSVFDATTYNSSFGTGAVTEDFEALGASMGEGEVGSSLSTNVGTFTTLGGVGTGGTVSGLTGNTGEELALRDGDVYGRTNTTPTSGAWFLDSNDTWGMGWTAVAAGNQWFDKIVFTILDASDVGAYLRIISGSDSYELRTGGKLPDGAARVVEVAFDSAVRSADIVLGNFTTSGGDTYTRNDGFSVDGMQIFTSLPPGGPTPVPLPAPFLMLGSALLGLGAVRKLRKV